jgi:hypothetical protein
MNSPPDINWNDLSQVQAEITRWASEQFPHRTDYHAFYKLMMHEIPELAVHKKERGVGTIGTELADCFILLLDLASLWKVDIAHAIFEKMQINYDRVWEKDENGIMQHVPARKASREGGLFFDEDDDGAPVLRPIPPDEDPKDCPF